MSPTTPPTPPAGAAAPAHPRGLRVDAERNRQRIVAAAREAFAEQGLDVPVEDIARRAGVGVGTLYRRYPTRADLVAAAFEPKMTAYADAARQALADPDPWRAFCSYVERICAMQAGDRGFTTVLTMTFPTAQRFEADRDQAFADFSTLVQRAKDARKLRADFVTEDMPLFLMANAGVLTATADAAPDAWRRLIGYLLQACAAPAAQAHPGTPAGATQPGPRAHLPPLPPPPEPAQMYRAMLRASQRQRAEPQQNPAAEPATGEGP